MSTSTTSPAKRKLEPSTNLPEPQIPIIKADVPSTTTTRPITSPSAVALAPATTSSLPPSHPIPTPAEPVTPVNKKRRASAQPETGPIPSAPEPDSITATASTPVTKKSRTNTPWTPVEEQRLKQMRDTGNSWSEIAKTFPARTEGSVKKHWYKDMHYAEFAEDESAALLAAIKDYESSKWKVIGQKVGKPAKACEQYAKENFGGRI